MSGLSLQEYAATIQRSGLLSAEEVRQQYDAFRATTESAADEVEKHAKPFAEYLQSTNVLTAWQNANLLKGRHRGLIFGKFKVLRLLGEGGMGRVFLAEDQMLRRQVALKVLPRKASQNESLLKRFHREAQALARLNHDNIVRVHDVDSREDTHYIVMEYVSGVDLSRKVVKEGPLDESTTVKYARQVAVGLAHAHDNELVHRDVKPANLLLDSDGTIKILDLGLALLQSDDSASITADPTKAMGTADYISPEQAINSHDIDHRTDIYSLGCSLYFLLTGTAPFATGTAAQRLMAHQMSTPDPINELRERQGLDPIGDELSEIIQRMMAKNPNDRFPDCNHVAAAFSPWLTDSSIGDTVADSASTRDTQSIRQLETISQSAASAGRPKKGKTRSSISRSRGKKSSRNLLLGISGLLVAVIAGLAVYQGTRPTLPNREEPTVTIDTTTMVAPASVQHFYVIGDNRTFHTAECRHTEGKDDLRELTAEECRIGRYSACRVCKPGR